MATTQEILDAATELGKLIATHDTARKFNDAIKALEADVEAQRVLTDYQRHITAVAEKQSKGLPIEVADKQKLEELQNKVIRNSVLRDFQLVQMDHLDLMRQVDAAVSGIPDGSSPSAAASPLANPDLGVDLDRGEGGG